MVQEVRIGTEMHPSGIWFQGTERYDGWIGEGIFTDLEGNERTGKWEPGRLVWWKDNP